MKSVVICGSRRFKKEIRKLEKILQEKGVVVYAPFLNMNRGIDKLENDLKRYAFTGLTLHHMEYIRKADVVYIYNKNGYMGNSGTMELGAAVVLGKPVYALEDDNTEMCRKVVFDKIVNTPSKLIKLLK